jgi:transcriptional regulator with XRE-family HTH domain
VQKYPSGRRAVASALRDARKAAHLSQRKLSAELGQVAIYCHKVEAALQGIDAEEVIPWAEACGTTASAIFGKVEGLLQAQGSPTASRALAMVRTVKARQKLAKVVRVRAQKKPR